MHIFPHKRLQHLHNIHYRDHGKAKITIQHAREDDDSIGMNDINFDDRATSRHVSCNHVRFREQIQKLKEEGTTICQRLAKIKNISHLQQ